MIGFLGNAYLWVKSAHVIFVIFWMAGLFMLPRFLAYHQEADPLSSENSVWAERERRLLGSRVITAGWRDIAGGLLGVPVL